LFWPLVSYTEQFGNAIRFQDAELPDVPPVFDGVSRQFYVELDRRISRSWMAMYMAGSPRHEWECGLGIGDCPKNLRLANGQSTEIRLDVLTQNSYSMVKAVLLPVKGGRRPGRVPLCVSTSITASQLCNFAAVRVICHVAELMDRKPRTPVLPGEIGTAVTP